MKGYLLKWTVGTFLLLMGFIGGRYFEKAKSGYSLRVLEQKEYLSPMGAVEWSRVTESVGFAFLEPDTTILRYEDRIIYKAKRVFQEAYPVAQKIKTSPNLIEWEDGELKFYLQIEKIKKENQ